MRLPANSPALQTCLAIVIELPVSAEQLGQTQDGADPASISTTLHAQLSNHRARSQHYCAIEQAASSIINKTMQANSQNTTVDAAMAIVAEACSLT